MIATLRVNPDIIIDGKHVASMWPRPEAHTPAIAYQHCEEWERDARWLEVYRDQDRRATGTDKHLGWTLEQYRGEKM